MLASTIARKSIPNVSYPSFVSQRVRMAYTFSNVGSVKLPREIQEVLELVTASQIRQSENSIMLRDDATHSRQGYHTNPAAPSAAVKYLVDESWIMCAVSGSERKSSRGTNHRIHAQPVSPASTSPPPRTCFTAFVCTPSAATMRSACKASPLSVVTLPFSAS
jgi:hypothetical protein